MKYFLLFLEIIFTLALYCLFVGLFTFFATAGLQFILGREVSFAGVFLVLISYIGVHEILMSKKS